MAGLTKELFAQKVTEYSLPMYRLAFSVLRNQQDAEDAVSSAVLRAYENIKSLRNPNRFKEWILQITMNEARNIYRKNKRCVSVEWEESLSPAFYDEHHELWDVVMQMDDEFRDVIVLFYYEQFSIKEMKNILGCKEGTVKSRLFRAKVKLRELLSEGRD